MNKCLILSLIFALVLLTACTTPAVAPAETATAVDTSTAHPEAELEAKVVEVVNLVDAHANVPDPWQPASVGMRIFPGGEVWAKEASTARLGLGKSLIRVAPNTIFTLNRPDDRTIHLNLNEGQIWLNVEGLEEGDEFKVEMPGATASVRGTLFSPFVTPQGVRGVSVLDGEVLFATEAGQKTVGAGTYSIAFPGEAPLEPLPNSDTLLLLWANAMGPELNMGIPFSGQVTCLPAFQGNLGGTPLFSPDGSQVTFKHYDPSQKSFQLNHQTVNLADFSPISQTPPFFSKERDYYTYNPSNDQLLYTQYGPGGHQICTANSNGQNATCFDTGEVGNDVYYYNPQWSPDGQRLLFNAEYYEQKESSVFTANPDGSNLTRITPPDSGFNSNAIWSPNVGDVVDQIAYLHADTQGLEKIYQISELQNNQLWVVNNDGSQAKMLADNIIGMPTPGWSPDGKWIAVPTTDGIGLFSPNGEKQILESYSQKCTRWSPSSTGWPLTYLATNQEDQEYSLYILNGPEQTPLRINGIAYGPYWSPTKDVAMVGKREVVDAEKKVYKTTVCFWQVIPNLWP